MQGELYKRIKRRHEENVDTYQEVEENFPEPVSSIMFAMNHDIHSILPAAFYRLALAGSDYEWEKTHPQDFVGYDDSVNISSARWSLLDRDTLLRFLRGKDELFRLFRDQIQNLKVPLSNAEFRSPHCLSVYICSDAMTRMAKGLIDFVMRGREDSTTIGFADLDCLAILEDLVDYPTEEDLCTACSESFIKAVRKQRTHLWAQLPRLFDVEAPSAIDAD